MCSSGVWINIVFMNGMGASTRYVLVSFVGSGYKFSRYQGVGDSGST